MTHAWHVDGTCQQNMDGQMASAGWWLQAHPPAARSVSMCNRSRGDNSKVSIICWVAAAFLSTALARRFSSISLRAGPGSGSSLQAPPNKRSMSVGSLVWRLSWAGRLAAPASCSRLRQQAPAAASAGAALHCGLRPACRRRPTAAGRACTPPGHPARPCLSPHTALPCCALCPAPGPGGLLQP